MSNARKAALHLLNGEWSRGVWRQWLSNIFQPPVEPPLPAGVAAPVTTAAPSGVGVGNCSSAGNACDLSTANADANTNGDEIILTPGTYTVGSQLSNTHQVSLHGEAGQPRPVIHGNVSTLDVLNLTGGASLSDLEVDLIGTSHAAAVELAGTGSLENVILNSSGPNSLKSMWS